MTDKDFIDGMVNGKFVQESHRAYCVLLYYSAVRKSEARRALREQFRLTPKDSFESAIRGCACKPNQRHIGRR
jgi:hypothetical protein